MAPLHITSPHSPLLHTLMDPKPSDIRNQSFSRALRGLDAEEVKQYLDQVAKTLERVSDERDQMKSRIASLEEKVERYGAVAEVLDETLDNTERSTEELVRDVKAKLKAAGKEAEEAAERAEEQARAIRRKTARMHERLRTEADSISDERRALAQRQQRLMEIAGQLTQVLAAEVDAGQHIADAPASNAPASNGPASNAPASNTPASKDGASGNDSTPPALGATSSEPRKKEKTKQEWIDSLFPNRLGSGEEAGGQQPSTEPSAADASSAGEPAQGQRSSSASHFEAIKQDVQSQDGSSQTSGSKNKNKTESGPDTNELERIWDIFDQTQ